MRIVSGRFRHRLLRTPPGNSTRPITDRAKVRLFDWLQPWLEGARAADVFSGTGTMGFEALSRGAASCVFFEHDRRAVELLRENVETLGVAQEVVCWRTDVFRTSFRPSGSPGRIPYDVVFFDPPYSLAETIRRGQPLYRSLERLARDEITSATAILVLRCPEHAQVEMPEPFALFHTIAVGQMSIRLFRKTGAEPVPPTSDEPPSIP
jgi:16S rRNA (guanine966-N2)-methyltransferase